MFIGKKQKKGWDYDTDDDASDYYFCDTEEEFKKKVLELISNYQL